MKTTVLLAGAAALASLAGCSGPAPAPTNTAAAVGEHGYIARVQALSPGQRAGMLFRAIEKSGGAGCQSVDRVDAMPASATGQPTWRVTCADGSKWTVAIGDDGTALVTGAHG